MDRCALAEGVEAGDGVQWECEWNDKEWERGNGVRNRWELV